mmetsp:Transcript_1754/g.6256  ORF Transcript_1754/g.6256 Transcript_1754/m.6256 type:complete len:595 (+) Transcript_1754:124-1908(+)
MAKGRKARGSGAVETNANDERREKDSTEEWVEETSEWNASPAYEAFLVVLASTCVKVVAATAPMLLYSTDLEVHRHWMSTVWQKPLHEWYPASGECSLWSLDYPPLFAWFELLCACWAHVFVLFLSFFSSLSPEESLSLSLRDQPMPRDPAGPRVQVEVQRMLLMRCTDADHPMPEHSHDAVAFMRLTVVAADLLLAAALLLYCRGLRWPKSTAIGLRGRGLTMLLVLLNACLFMVDHMHFQYNGMLLGILVLGMAALEQGRPYAAAATFAVLVNMKHLFLGVCPAVFIYLLRAHCCPAGERVRWLRIVGLALTGVVVFAISLGPFVVMGQAKLLVSRLFPVERGLCHAYWAPNLWALYAGADWALVRTLRLAGREVEGRGGFTGGLVASGESTAVLPMVSASFCSALLLLSLLPILWKLWKMPFRHMVVPAVSLSALCMFSFGFHTHEKALLVPLIPLTLLLLQEGSPYADIQFIMSVLANAAVGPLLQDMASVAIAIDLQLLSVVVQSMVLYEWGSDAVARVGWLWRTYLAGVACTYCYWAFGHGLLVGERLPFLPLLLHSCYCALGVLALLARFYCRFLAAHQEAPKEKAA